MNNSVPLERNKKQKRKKRGADAGWIQLGAVEIRYWYGTKGAECTCAQKTA